MIVLGAVLTLLTSRPTPTPRPLPRDWYAALVARSGRG